VIYVAGLAVALGYLWKTTKDRFIGLCAVVLLALLAIYWLGLLMWSIGVLPNTTYGR